MIDGLNILEFIRSLKIDGNRLIIEINDIEKNRPLVVKYIVESGGIIQTVSENMHSLEEVYLSVISSQ